MVFFRHVPAVAYQEQFQGFSVQSAYEFPGYIQSLLPRLEEWLQTVSRDERDAIANDISDMLTYLAPEAKEFKQLNIKP